MRRPPVHLNDDQRSLILRLLMESFLRREIEVVTACVDSVHFHVLARFPDRRADHWVGIAKKESSHFAKQAGNGPAGGLWAAGGKCVPIADRGHQLATARYILDHQSQAAAVWFGGKLLPAGNSRSAQGASSQGFGLRK
jgi:REP element-mobilizing transposase RayT